MSEKKEDGDKVPVNINTGEKMPPEECETLADRLLSGEMRVVFSPEVKKAMAEKGLTEDDLRKALIDGALAGVRKS